MGCLALGFWVAFFKQPERPQKIKIYIFELLLIQFKIVQIHNITKKPAKIYVLNLYNFDAM
jgi:hypothetical protein